MLMPFVVATRLVAGVSLTSCTQLSLFPAYT